MRTSTLTKKPIALPLAGNSSFEKLFLWLIRYTFVLVLAGSLYSSMPDLSAVLAPKRTNTPSTYNNPAGATFGYTSGSFNVTDAGQATYSIPITVSPGTGGIQPTLAIVYSSQGGNSFVGKGFSISGFSMISRSGHTQAQDGEIRSVKVDSLDTYSLDGERLYAISGAYGAPNTEYRTEQNNFTKVISYGNYLGCPTNFKAWTKAGLIYEYGNTANSLIEAEGSAKAMFWLLNKISDTKGNYMTFSYGELNGEYWPASISYTGNTGAGLAPYASVVFTAISRLDNTERYVNGYKIPQTKLLSKIESKYGANITRRYNLTYNNGTFNDVSLLASVQECGIGGTTCLTPTVFHWTTENKLGFDYMGSSILNNLGDQGGPVSGSTKLLNGDWDGDGMQDLLRIDPTTGNNRFYRNGGQNGTFNFSSNNPQDNKISPNTLLDLQPSAMAYSKIDQTALAAENPYSLVPIDVNADGFTDLIAFPVKASHQNLCNYDVNYSQAINSLYYFNPPIPNGTLPYPNIPSWINGWGACKPIPGYTNTTHGEDQYPNPTNNIYQGTITNRSHNCQNILTNSSNSLLTTQSVNVCNQTFIVKKSLTAHVNGTQPCTQSQPFCPSTSGPPKYFPYGSNTPYIGYNLFCPQSSCGFFNLPSSNCECAVVSKTECEEFQNDTTTNIFPSNKYDHIQNNAACKVFINNKGNFDNLAFTEVSANGIPAQALCQIGIVLGAYNCNPAVLNVPCDYRYAYNIDYSALHFSDFNGDGKTDIFLNAYDYAGFNPWANFGGSPTGCTTTYTGGYPSGNKYHLYLNNGISGGQMDYIVSYPNLPAGLDKKYLSPIDINQDGLSDLFYFHPTNGTNTIYKNIGNGNNVAFDNGTALISADTLIPTSGEAEVSFGDFNADGNIDFVWRQKNNGTLKFIVNKGNNVFFKKNSGITSPSSGNIQDGIFSSKDFNADGFADLYWYGSNGTNRWYMNNGNWNFTMALNPASPNIAGYENPIAVGAMTRSQFFESFSNRGLSDFMSYSFSAGGVSFQDWYQNRITQYHQLDSIRTGDGATIALEYAPITVDSIYEKGVNAQYPEYDFQGAYYVLSSYSTEDGIGGRNQIKYKYKQARMNMQGRGFRGFKEVDIIDVTSGITTKKYFEEDYQKLGAIKLVKTVLHEGLPNARLLSEVSYSNKHTSLAANPKVNFAYVDSVLTHKWDLSGTLITNTISYNVYNSFGDVVKTVMNYGSGNIDSTRSTYDTSAINLNNWWLGRLVRADLYKHRGSQSIHRASAFEYDITSGLMTKEITEPDSGALRKITKEYTYNAFGNTIQTRSIAWNGTQTEHRVMDYVYDNSGRFKLTTTNELGHQAVNTYEPFTGLLLTEKDINNLITTYEYDDMGRLKFKYYPDGTWEAQDTRKCSNWLNSLPGETTVVIVQSSNHPQKEIYYDILGRQVRVITLSFNGTVLFQTTKYNKKGNKEEESRPYYYNTVNPVKTIQYYDDLNRVIEKQVPGPSGPVSYYYSYTGLSTKVTNPLNQTQTTLQNILGQTVSVIDNQGAFITYDYDAAGNNTKVNQGGIQVVNTFDHFGRQIQFYEPHIGTIKYKYNSFSELLSQIDADNDTVSFQYDSLGRTKLRVEKEGTTTWTYDSQPKGKGMLAQVTAPGAYQYTPTYDLYSRLSTENYTIDSSNYSTAYTYDNKGRLVLMTYPTSFNGAPLQIENQYNGQGFLDKVKIAYSATNLWQATSVNEWGQVVDEMLGNGVNTHRTFNTQTGWLNGINTNFGNTHIQDFDYTYNAISNLLTRNDQIRSYTETFTYDNLNRLTSSKINNLDSVKVAYNAFGNIKYKSDVGNYKYNNPSKPQQLSSIEKTLPGVCIPTFQNSIRYHSYQMVKSIRNGDDSLSLDYGASRERTVQKFFRNNQLKEKKIYVGSFYEKEVTDSTIKELCYIRAGGSVFAVYNKEKKLSTNVISTSTDYWHKDHLGSLQTVTNQAGAKIAEFNFDPWGKRRNLDGSAMDLTFTVNAYRSDRGFTGHEHLDMFGLINMNGRIFDPVIGRFLSPDPVFQDNSDLQSFNRYAYVRNNPLNLTDPSGFFWDEIGDFFGGLGNAIGDAVWGWHEMMWEGVCAVNKLGENVFGKEAWQMGLTIAIGIATSGAGAGLLAVALSGAAAGGLNAVIQVASAGGTLKDAVSAGLKGAAIGGAMAVATFGVGSLAEPFKAATSFGGNAAYFGIKTIGHGLVQGTYQAATGGSFSSGFLSGAGTAAVNVLGDGMMESAGKTGARVISGMVGGTCSVIGGGKFANGAISGVFVRMYNDEADHSVFSCKTSTKVDGMGSTIAKAYGLNASVDMSFDLLNETSTFKVGAELGGNKFSMSLDDAGKFSANMCGSQNLPGALAPIGGIGSCGGYDSNGNINASGSLRLFNVTREYKCSMNLPNAASSTYNAITGPTSQGLYQKINGFTSSLYGR